MIRVSVVDNSGESRARLVDMIDSYLRSGLKEASLLPRVSVKPVSPQEIKFSSAPDICIVGPSLIEKDLSEIAKIKAMLPNTPVIVQLSDRLNTLAVVEQLANLGADDVLSPLTGAHEFLRKLIMVSRRAKARSNGKLIVIDGGKGGVGVTTISTALGEAYLSQGKKVALIDLDFESQDLSRFLQARPFVNENLRLLLDHERPVTEETVEQTLSRVWQNEESFACMAPVADSDDLFDSQCEFHRTYVSVIELLDQKFDIIIVDLGSAHGVMRRSFYRIADQILFVVGNDPASVYASVEKFQRVRAAVGAACKVTAVANEICSLGLSIAVLKDEFLRAARLDESLWFSKGIGFCKLGLRWPGTGSTMFSMARSQVKEVFIELSRELGGVESSATASSPLDFLKSIGKRFIKKSQSSVSEVIPLLIGGTAKLDIPTKRLELPQVSTNVVALSETAPPSESDRWESLDAGRLVSGVK